MEGLAALSSLVLSWVSLAGLTWFALPCGCGMLTWCTLSEHILEALGGSSLLGPSEEWVTFLLLSGSALRPCLAGQRHMRQNPLGQGCPHVKCPLWRQQGQFDDQLARLEGEGCGLWKEALPKSSPTLAY